MPLLPSFPRSSLIVAHSTGAGLALLLAAVTPTQAEIIKVADLLAGIVMTQAQCAAVGQTVWVRSFGRDFCVRYYLSTAGGEGKRPVVFLQGDKLGRRDPATKNFYQPEKLKDIDTDAFARTADSLSKATKTTAIYLARIGIDGTSGHHGARRTLLELYMVNAALDAIRKRHGFEGFNLVGQSGGAALIGGLAALRKDIACAVPGSGPLGRLGPGKPQRNEAEKYFFATDAIPAILQNRTMRVIVVTDPADKTVSPKSQNAFVAQMRRAGGRVEQHFVEATDEKHHGVYLYARRAVSECIRGAGTQEIGKDLAELVAKTVTAANAKKAEKAEQAKTNGPAQQPAPRGRPAATESPRSPVWPPRV